MNIVNNQNILPMSKSEIKHLDFVLADLKSRYRTALEDEMMNNGFSSATVLNYDNDVVLVEVNYGINISIPELCFKKEVKIDRLRMEVMETNEQTKA